jgi:hypothetical protein
MISWISLALALLKLINAIVSWSRERELITRGQDMEIAKQTAAILAQTEYAKDVRKQIAALDEAAVDRALRDLDPK